MYIPSCAELEAISMASNEIPKKYLHSATAELPTFNQRVYMHH